MQNGFTLFLVKMLSERQMRVIAERMILIQRMVVESTV